MSQYSSIAAHIFVSIALLTFLGIVAYHVYLKCPRSRCTQRPSSNAESNTSLFQGMRGYDDVDDVSEDEDITDDASGDTMLNFFFSY